MSYPRSVLCFSCFLFTAALGAPAFAGQPDAPPSAGSSAPNLPSPPTQAAPGKAWISFADERMSANFENLPLQNLGNALSHKAGVAIVFMDNAASQKVSARFQKLSMDEGLRRILSNQDVFYFYSSDGRKASALRAVWIYPKGKARGVAPVPPDQWGSNKDLATQLVSFRSGGKRAGRRNADPEKGRRRYRRIAQGAGRQGCAGACSGAVCVDAVWGGGSLLGPEQAGPGQLRRCQISRFARSRRFGRLRHTLGCGTIVQRSKRSRSKRSPGHNFAVGYNERPTFAAAIIQRSAGRRATRSLNRAES